MLLHLGPFVTFVPSTRVAACTDRILDQFCLLQGQVNQLWSSFELVGDRRSFTCSESVCQCGIEATRI